MAEFLAVVLALQKFNAEILLAVIITDSLSLCAALSVGAESHIIKAFRAFIPPPPHLRKVRLVWVPGHKGLLLHEMANSLAVSNKWDNFTMFSTISLCNGCRISQAYHYKKLHRYITHKFD